MFMSYESIACSLHPDAMDLVIVAVGHVGTPFHRDANLAVSHYDVLLLTEKLS